MLEIKTTGFEDYLDGSANIKTLVIGGPGAGKTRWSSFWPKPFFVDCEDGRGSIADRAVPYVRVRSSKDMLDVLEHLKSLEGTPKAQRKYQTVVVDTADSFQRIVKEEWVTANKAGSFTGFDAWGYLDTKMQLLFTRLLNLDYNVVVLVHYKTKEHKDGDNTVREFVLQMQGATADQIFNDFGLVGWMGTYWEAGKDGREQKRGLTFQPTPEKPFLKDRFNVTPMWMEVKFEDNDYLQLFEAFMSKADDGSMPEVATVGEVPNHVPTAGAAVAPPKEGGPLPPGPRVNVAEIPLDKQTKEQLLETAKGLGITVRGNTLKAEIVNSIEHARAAAASTAGPVGAAANVATPTEPQVHRAPEAEANPTTSAGGSQPAESVTSVTAATASAASSAPSEASQVHAPAGGSPSQGDPWAGSPAWDPAAPSEAQAEALITSELGGEVISEERSDAPATPQPAPPSAPVAQPSAAPQGPSACADCGADLTDAWTDPVKKGQMRMSFIKHRRYLCGTCYENN